LLDVIGFMTYALIIVEEGNLAQRRRAYGWPIARVFEGGLVWLVAVLRDAWRNMGSFPRIAFAGRTSSGAIIEPSLRDEARNAPRSGEEVPFSVIEIGSYDHLGRIVGVMQSLAGAQLLTFCSRVWLPILTQLCRGAGRGLRCGRVKPGGVHHSLHVEAFAADALIEVKEREDDGAVGSEDEGNDKRDDSANSGNDEGAVGEERTSAFENFKQT
jgi:hypothetical protein